MAYLPLHDGVHVFAHALSLQSFGSLQFLGSLQFAGVHSVLAFAFATGFLVSPAKLVATTMSVQIPKMICFINEI